MSDDPQPIPLSVTLPPSRLTKQLRDQISAEVNAIVPDGKRLVVLGVVDEDRNVTFGVATRATTGKVNWQLSAEASREWSTKRVSGRLAIMGVF